MIAGRAAEHGEQKTVVIGATDLKAHQTATDMRASSVDQKTVK
jgi:hypothetical protein